MLANELFILDFSYQDKPVSVLTKMNAYSIEYTTYKLNFNLRKYMVIRFNQQWRVITNTKPCAQFNKSVIDAIKHAIQGTVN